MCDALRDVDVGVSGEMVRVFDSVACMGWGPARGCATYAATYAGNQRPWYVQPGLNDWA